jgi:hypothetical protein
LLINRSITRARHDAGANSSRAHFKPIELHHQGSYRDAEKSYRRINDGIQIRRNLSVGDQDYRKLEGQEVWKARRRNFDEVLNRA